MTPEKIAELRALEKTASKRWEEVDGGVGANVGPCLMPVFLRGEQSDAQWDKDAALIVAMRNALPGILDALEDAERRAAGDAYVAAMNEGGEEILRQEIERERKDHAELRAERDAANARAEAAEAGAAGLRYGLQQVKEEARGLREARALAEHWLNHDDAGAALLAERERDRQLMREAAEMLRRYVWQPSAAYVKALAKKLEEASHA